MLFRLDLLCVTSIHPAPSFLDHFSTIANVVNSFELKPFSVNTVKKIMGKMKMKKSAGADEISQECLLLGKSILAGPLTTIINASIKSGFVPDSWKEAVVVPILK